MKAPLLQFPSGSNDTRASNALDALIRLTQSRTPFTISCVDYTLKNMVIESITRTRDPENENALIFIATLKELVTLDVIVARDLMPTQNQLRQGDPSYTQCIAKKDLGNKRVTEVFGVNLPI